MVLIAHALLEKVSHPATRDTNGTFIGLGLQVAQSQCGKAFVGIYPSRALFLQQGVFLLSEDSKVGDLGLNQGLVYCKSSEVTLMPDSPWRENLGPEQKYSTVVLLTGSQGKVSPWESVNGTGRGMTGTRRLKESCCKTSAADWEL